MADYYAVLEVSRDASPEVIKAAYEVLCRKNKGSAARMRQLDLAYEVLSDEDRREAYDNGQTPVQGNGKHKVVGQYRLLSKIAEGGFGVTYKGEHILSKCPVCIKHASGVSADDAQLLLDEAKTVWDLRHHGIPAMRDVLEMDDGSMSLVMSYIPGPTLAQLVENDGPLDPEHVCWIVDRCLNILAYLHEHNVVHGDVKPQNIILPPDPADPTVAAHQIVMVDYGLSLVKPTRTTANKGYTPYFAAPEQLSGKPLIPQTDLYGLGMTMVFALGGDVGSKRVPDYTPDELCRWMNRMIVHGPLARPDPLKDDLQAELRKVRLKCFGREFSGMKRLRVKVK